MRLTFLTATIATLIVSTALAGPATITATDGAITPITARSTTDNSTVVTSTGGSSTGNSTAT
ncbi:uncharacterized protein FOMMEDRAFT_152336 [Fomitiporia mediterranea MF3/22]|uniref:uncharacterized protein n=1 Tax=Fomitiporia mediterranea (strain MF3/22) TaxID=694068 RepID=UPI00044078A7|nr:uncharacterized protein FOMMEDRAFT_152336 [Fomitiporia mediterranea MF3/22]EJD06995.1 hypothetical protein FOMMEDRAFT_152336 [Fomitiporia mediterranea MF3/22]